MNLMYILSDLVTVGQLKPIKSNCMDNYADSLLLKKSSSAMQDAILLAVCFLRQQEACSHWGSDPDLDNCHVYDVGVLLLESDLKVTLVRLCCCAEG